MKTSLLVKVAIVTALLSGAPHSFPQSQLAKEADSAKQFVESLYVRYGPNGNPPDLSGENAGQFFDPSLIQLAKDVHATAGPNYSGALDYNHLCNCKDTNVTFPNLRIVAHPVTTHSTVATVEFIDKDGTENRILINLTPNAGNWRISDIEDFTGPRPHTDLRSLLHTEFKAWSKVQRSQ
jgi:hypothetical protein